MPKITDDRPADIDSDAPANSEQLARQQAIQQIRARRRFKVSTASAALGVTLLVPIWAATEYRNFRKLMASAVPMTLTNAQRWSLFNPAIHGAHYAALRQMIETANRPSP